MNSKKAIYQLETIRKEIELINHRLAAEKWKTNWQTLFAIMLSAQTRDTTTIKVCTELYKKCTSLSKISKIKIHSLEKILRPLNYYKTKAKHLSQTSKILIKQKRIPKTIEELIKLPGVGRKTANVYLAQVYNSPTIGVDTHVKRLSIKLNWTKQKDPKNIEEDLKKLFPKIYWNNINRSLVVFGQIYGSSEKKENKKLKEIFINKIS